MVTQLASYALVKPLCRYFGECGGCALQDLSYPDQVLSKTHHLQALFSEIPGMQSITVAAAEEPWRYRNKAEFSFGISQGRMTLGFHAAKSFQRVIDLDDCLLMPESAIGMLRTLRDLAEISGLPVYNPRSHAGFFRYAIVRISHARQRLLLCLVTTSAAGKEGEQISQIAQSLMQAQPCLESVYWAQTDQLADAALPEQLTLIAGKELMEDVMGPFQIQLAPLSFIQTHSGQADRLYRAVCTSLGQDTQGQVVWDLYCGVGLVSLYLSRQFRLVYGIDSETHHLYLAKQNAAKNGSHNIRWVTGKAEEVLKDRRFWLREAKPDVVVVDPPRTGLHIAVISAILAARPSRIAYISCNPETLLRDIEIFAKSFPAYHVVHAEAFDMFPQTPHVETLVILSR